MPAGSVDWNKRPSEYDGVIMEFGDIEARKRSRRRSKRRDTDGIVEEDDYSEEESFANIDSHLER